MAEESQPPTNVTSGGRVHGLDVTAAVRSGVDAQLKGQYEEAESIYRRVLGAAPDHPDAHYLMGRLCGSMGRTDEAISWLSRAVALNPKQSNYFNDLALLLRRANRLDQAVAAGRKAVDLRPDNVEAWCNLGNALRDLDLLDDAESAYFHAVTLRPDIPELHRNLGNLLRLKHHVLEAERSLREAVRLKPNDAVSICDLGIALRLQGRLDDAVDCFARASAIAPDFADAHANLGNALVETCRPERGADSLQLAVRIRPNDAMIMSNLGTALRESGRLDEAETTIRRAIEIDPGLAAARAGLAMVLRSQGLIEQAIDSYRKAFELKESAARAADRALDWNQMYSNYLFDLCSHPATDGRLMYDESLKLTRRMFGQPVQTPFAKGENRPADRRNDHRRIRIGYVSGDFRAHPVARFMSPIIEGHDRERFEICCFSNTPNPDQTTEWFRKRSDQWHGITGMTDDAAAALIRRLEIDVLVDLSLHTARNRLGIFARKPAPVQATYLAYCGTSGLSSIDYLLCDPRLIPPGYDRTRYTETPFPLPASYWCYRPTDDCPEINPLPMLKSGHLTFGCLNNFGKVTSQAIDAWCRILKAVPRSRLRLHSFEGSHRDRVRQQLAGAGIEPERLDFVGFLQPEEFLRQFLEIDIALDPFPFAGGTTTLDTLWMGVPVVTLAGEIPTSRGGVSILTNLGLPELIAGDLGQYIRIALNLASDHQRMTQLRSTLRQRMQSSPLMDERALVSNLESAYEIMISKRT